VLVEKGALKNKPAKLDRDRDSALAYQREIHKGRNEGDGWIPPSKPKPVNKKCLLIPERLWGDLGFLPDSSPDDDGSGGGEGLVTSGNLEVTSSNLDEVTTCEPDNSTVSALSSLSGNLVTKKYIEEEKKLVESGTTQDDTQQQWDIFSTDVCSEESEPLQNLVTGLPESVNELETIDNTGVESVTNEGYFEVTQGAKEVTSDAIAKRCCEAQIAPSIALQDAPEAAVCSVATSKAVPSVPVPQPPSVGTRIKILTGEYGGLVGIVQGLKGKMVLASPEAHPGKPELGYFSDEYRVIGDRAITTVAPSIALQDTPEDSELPTVVETVQGTAQKPADEVTALAGDEWQVGDRVLIDGSDLPVSLKRFDGCSGVVVQVAIASCLIRFDDDGEVMHILLRGLRRA
jgi:hypothetical protein